MVKLAVFDDTDPSITYNGNWSVLGVLSPDRPEYNGTVHHTADNSATADITFQGKLSIHLTFSVSYLLFVGAVEVNAHLYYHPSAGTGISVYGSVNAPGIYGTPGSSYVLDQNGPLRFNASGSFRPPNRNIVLSHVLLYQSSTVPDGRHTVKITPDGLADNGRAFYIDFFTVSVADSTSVDNVVIDDGDGAVLYGGSWASEGGEFEYLSTTHRPTSSGNETTTSSAAIQFNGTFLAPRIFSSFNSFDATRLTLSHRH